MFIPKKEIDALFASHAHNARGIEMCGASAPSRDSYLHIDSFMQGLRLRASTPVMAHLVVNSGDKDLPNRKSNHARLVHQRKHNNEKSNAESGLLMGSTIGIVKEEDDTAQLMTDLEREQRRIARKVVASKKDPGYAKYRTEFVHDTVLRGGSVRPGELLDHLNHSGSNLTQTEFDLLVSNLTPAADGRLNLTEFTDMISHQTAQVLNSGDMGRLSLGLANDGSCTGKRIHNYYCVGDIPNASSSNQSSHEDRLMGRPYVGSSHHALLAAETTAAKDEVDRKTINSNRVKWTKVVECVRSNKSNLEKLLRSKGEKTDTPLSTPELARVLASAGVRLGTDDVKLLEAHCSSQQKANDSGDGNSAVTIRSLVQSLGMHITSSRHVEAPIPGTSKANSDFENKNNHHINHSVLLSVLNIPQSDYVDDNGIMSASHSSLMANPTYRTTMVEAPHCNDKRHCQRRR